MSDVLTTDFKNASYWWDKAPPVPSGAPALDSSYDAAIVGSGFTGLRAALTLLRGGRSVVLLDSGDPGCGASRSNAGFLGRVLKKSFAKLLATHGAEHAVAVYRELDQAYQTTLGVITEEKIDCHAERCGRFMGATSPAHYGELERELETMRRHLGFDYRMIPHSSQRDEMATDVYCGGAVMPDLGALHPGLYHKGLLDAVLRAGGVVRGQAEVKSIERPSGRHGFRVASKAGTVKARDVVIATNGYTPRHFSWHSRRVIPFTGYMAATELLPEALLAKLLPQRRTVLDTNMNINFFRPAPDTPRLLFGGATGSGMQDVTAIAARLHDILRRVLPDLADVRLSHVWTGLCAGTFDMMPHIGCQDGMWYGMGYNFAGVPMGSYFGLKIGQLILGLPEGRSVFAKGAFPTLPLYTGNPWFVPYAMRYFDWHDRRTAAKKTAAAGH
ncbi:MAG: NAD(P)/FAD-dependent oxidoreductase [Alphaproteobacteria bacterium]